MERGGPEDPDLLVGCTSICVEVRGACAPTMRQCHSQVKVVVSCRRSVGVIGTWVCVCVPVSHVPVHRGHTFPTWRVVRLLVRGLAMRGTVGCLAERDPAQRRLRSSLCEAFCGRFWVSELSRVVRCGVEFSRHTARIHAPRRNPGRHGGRRATGTRVPSSPFGMRGTAGRTASRHVLGCAAARIWREQGLRP